MLLQTTTALADTLRTAIPAAAPPANALSMFDLILKGGVIMVPIGILSVVAVYIIIERYLYIQKAGRVDSNLLRGIEDAMNNGNVQTATSLCKSNNSSIARILEWGLNRVGRPIKDVENALEAAGNIEIARMNNKLAYLGVIAGIAPMLGFVGTIIGVIKIFYEISLSDNISIGTISEGLYVKMITSCAGLIVGIVAYAGFHFITIKIDKFTLKAETAMFDFMNLLHNS